MRAMNKVNPKVIALKECAKFNHNAVTLTTIHKSTAKVYYFASGN